MRLRFLPVLVLFLQTKVFAERVWTGISSEKAVPVSCRVISQDENETVLFFRVEGFHSEEVITSRGPASVISCPGMVSSLDPGVPDLPTVTVSLLVPSGMQMKAEVMSASTLDFGGILVAPSKGHLYRDQDPSSVPYTYSPSYDAVGFSPKETATLRDPYVIRDFTGVAVTFHPFTYDPASRSLRVCFSATVRIRPAAGQSASAVRFPDVIDETFSAIYNAHFINYSSFNYLPLEEQGRMLIVADSSFMGMLRPLADWKNRIGLSTELVSIDAVGRSSAALKSFVQTYYQTHGLTFLLLAGDNVQIPPFSSPAGDSDPSYGFLAGSDSYAEVIVGRFSANDSAELATQIERTLSYEACADTAASWLARAVCIASDQGPGDDNEFDFEHARLMRQDLLGYTYTVADELYDGSQGGADSSGSPAATELIDALNAGRGIVTYTGHGSSGGFVTTGFGLSDVSQLENADRLPFIWSVACVNGDFVNGTCLAEGLLRATDSSGAPTGAIATLMSTVNQSWSPPMDAQDEMVDLLTVQYPSNVKRTFGGISVNGCMHMNDQYGPAGYEMTDTWNCFGDPSLQLRTSAPRFLVVGHPAVLFEGGSGFTGTCSLDDARLCLSLHDSVYAFTRSHGGVFSFLYASLHAGDTLLLTVTGPDAVPYTARIPVLPSLTGINEVEADEWILFPNPAAGTVWVSGNRHSDRSAFRIYDLSGRIVREEVLSHMDNASGLDLSGLATGCYQLVVSTATDRRTFRLLVR